MAIDLPKRGQRQLYFVEMQHLTLFMTLFMAKGGFVEMRHLTLLTLKNEMLQGGSFATEADARIEIFDFIESYYNHHRKHSALGYQTPAQFEAKNRPNN